MAPRPKTDAPVPERRSPAAARVAWAAGCLALAWVAVGLELDRASLDYPGLAEATPAPLRTFALRSVVRTANAQGRKSDTLAASEVYLQRSPLPAESLSLYAQALIGVGKPDRAYQAFAEAAARGWRDIPTQLVMVTAALSGDEPAIASDRLAALWNVGSDASVLAPQTSSVIANPEARVLFARHIAERSDWSDAFLTWGTTALPERAFAQTISQALVDGAQFDCATLSKSAGMLVRAGKPDEAAMLWKGPCAATKGPADGVWSFEPVAAGAVAGPFEWTYPPAPGLDHTLKEEGGRWRLDYSNTDALPKVLARRFARLTPGAHEVTLASGATGQLGVTVWVRCIVPGQDNQVQVARARVSADQPLSFTVPDKFCPAQVLEMVVPTGSGQGLALTAR